ncbi:MAG: response regulator, partial [Elusimicrobia bacterium]|nr:response regulator [Elusimicrobiota bacterium]
PAPTPGAARPAVLLVEDEPPVRHLLRRVLDAHGYRVLDAADADGALRVFEAVPNVALAVVDVVMPGGGGPALVERLRERKPDLKVLFISGYADQKPLPQAVGGEPFPFLAKPFSSESLLAKIREILSSRA